MQEPVTIALVLAIAVPTLFGVIITIILVAGRARPQPGLGPRAGSDGGVMAVGGAWNAQILGSGITGRLGGTLGSQFGVFRIDHGALNFTPDDSPNPAWSIPCHQLAARSGSIFSTAQVELWTPQVHLRCNVSRERINRISRNTIKELREPRYAREFVDTLVAQGARRV